ncbi:MULTISPECIES: ammonia-dependent NAD(+) synthetase [Corynebacterium]|uniref:ammonia-dependent NAD(+) synthetase n=1 Tax=Corynebacterium TaxID=1716 RepID=UPI0008A2405D|nr:ammonia-dependent NAD(+) synthetase [Corynebacterium sp. HMSC073D01]OFO49668.1 NAD(+) synthetase [Corynebacterium sp. HMSC073D01]
MPKTKGIVVTENTPNLQKNIVKALGTRPLIDSVKEVESRVTFLADYLSSTGLGSYVLGISGGQDSTLAGKLAQMAVEKLRESGTDTEFFAVRLPYGIQSDANDVDVALEFISPDHTLEINIKEGVDALSDATAAALGMAHLGDFNKGNVKARARMIAQYAVAGEHRGLVIGTDHAAENITGFFTKFGDGASDILPLWGLNKSQGAELLRHMGAPESTWKKVPTADLEEDRPALPDEEALGVTYPEIDAYLRGEEISPEASAVIERHWRINEHKRHLPVTPLDTWWR